MSDDYEKQRLVRQSIRENMEWKETGELDSTSGWIGTQMNGQRKPCRWWVRSCVSEGRFANTTRQGPLKARLLFKSLPPSTRCCLRG